MTLEAGAYFQKWLGAPGSLSELISINLLLPYDLNAFEKGSWGSLGISGISDKIAGVV